MALPQMRTDRLYRPHQSVPEVLQEAGGDKVTYAYEVKPCTAPGSASGAGEWCKEYCPYYGSKRCYYDPETKRMMLKMRTYEEELA